MRLRERHDAVFATATLPKCKAYRDGCNDSPQLPANGWFADFGVRRFRTHCKCAGVHESSARRSSAIHKPACQARAETVAAGRAGPDPDLARNRNATSSFERMIVAGHMHEQRRGIN